MPSLEQVKQFRSEMYQRSMALVERKGADYNRDQQLAGNTLFNLEVCALLGVVGHSTQGILVRLTDKLMRLISLCKDPSREAEVSDESVLDTIADCHNYADYLGLLWQQTRQAMVEPSQAVRPPIGASAESAATDPRVHTSPGQQWQSPPEVFPCRELEESPDHRAKPFHPAEFITSLQPITHRWEQEPSGKWKLVPRG